MSCFQMLRGSIRGLNRNKNTQKNTRNNACSGREQPVWSCSEDKIFKIRKKDRMSIIYIESARRKIKTITEITGTYKNIWHLMYSEQEFHGKWYYIQKMETLLNGIYNNRKGQLKNRKILKNYWKLMGAYQRNKVTIVYGDLSGAAARTRCLKKIQKEKQKK